MSSRKQYDINVVTEAKMVWYSQAMGKAASTQRRISHDNEIARRCILVLSSGRLWSSMFTPRAVPVQEGVRRGVQEGNCQSKNQGLHSSETINTI